MLSKYILKKANARYVNKKDKLYQDASIDDCIKYCNDEIGVDCKSFHFCYLTSECVLSKSVVPNDNEEFQNNNYCDVYESN